MVTIGVATKEEIQQYPRAFALLSLLNGTSKGHTISKQDLTDLVIKKEGDQNKLNGKEEMTFQEFAAIFNKSSQDGDKSEGKNCLGYAAHGIAAPLVPYRFDRDSVGPDDVSVSIIYAGICHSDVHQVLGEWNNSTYPMVPGHEIVGAITEIGPNVTEWNLGDIVGIGCMVNSKCQQTCDNCVRNEEQYCLKGFVGTYNSTDLKGNVTQGGYSTHITCHKKFVLKMPTNIDLAAATPLLCAGITTYSPMKFYGLDKPGQSIAVMGLGGLGHVAVKFAKAFGCKVTVLSTSSYKKDEAINVLGADAFLNTKDQEALKEAARSFDGIVDTVSAPHDIGSFLSLLKTDGKYVMVGAPPDTFPINAFQLLGNRVSIGGSLIGGIKETQDMLDFCSKHNITCQVEVIPADYVNTAYDRMLKNDIKYRFVIDIAASLIK